MRLIRLLKRDLREEVRSWVEDDLVSNEQAERICQRYGMNFHDHEKTSMGYYVLVTLGYLFVGLALMTLIGANWQEIPRGVRMGGLVLTTLGINLFACYQYRMNKHTAATAWFFLGSLCYGVSIMLIAQIYHIGEHFPDGIFYWLLGVLPLALLMRSNALMLLATTLAFLWFFVESSLHFFPVYFPLFLAVLAWYVFKIKQSNLLFLALVSGVGFFIEYTLSWHLGPSHRFDFGVENIVVIAAMFLLFHAFSLWLSVQKQHRIADYGVLLNVWVLRFVLVSMLIFSFEVFWEALIEATWQYPTQTLVGFILVVVASIALQYWSTRKFISTTVFGGYLTFALLVLLYGDDQHAVTMQVIDNLFLIGLSVYLIVQGVRQGISHYFYLGVLTVMLTALLRYIDLIGDYIGAAILFAVFSAILLATARYWKANLKKEGVS